MLSTLYSDIWLHTISGIFITLAYSEPCLFRHIGPYSAIFNNNSYNNINLLFHFYLVHILLNEILKKLCFLTAMIEKKVL